MSPAYRTIHERVVDILAMDGTRDAKLRAICYLLRKKVPHYDWVGFYLVDPETPRELVLGPFEGAATEHTRIPFGKGICGQVALSEETLLVQDVTAEENYLSCGLEVRSEIVVPISKNGTFVAQLDIDSHATSPFTPDDRLLTEGICALLPPLF